MDLLPDAIPLQYLSTTPNILHGSALELPTDNEGRNRRTDDEGNKWIQCVTALAVTLVAMAAGNVLAWTVFALPELRSQENGASLTENEEYWIVNMPAVGALFGALPAGYLADRFGRKIVISAVSTFLVLHWVLVAVDSSVEVLYVARFVAGVAVGPVSVVVPIFIGEIAQRSLRGALGMLLPIMMLIGQLYSCVLSYFLDYRFLGIPSCVVAVMTLRTMFLIPETPPYFVKKRRIVDAMKSLQFFRGSRYDARKEVQDLEDSINGCLGEASVGWSSASKAFIVCFGMILFRQFCGYNSVMLLAFAMFNNSGVIIFGTNGFRIVCIVAQVLVYCTASVLVDRVGRRILLMISASAMTLYSATVAYYLSFDEDAEDSGEFTVVICLFGFMIAFCLGFGPVPWVMFGELFPYNVKGVSVSVVVCIHWVLEFLTSYFTGHVHKWLKLTYLFRVFAVMNGLSVFFVLYLVPETKRKSLTEIQALFSEIRTNGFLRTI